MYRIDHCVAGCMTHYLLWGKLFPMEAKEVPRLKPPRLPSGDNFFHGRYRVIHTATR